MHIQHIEAVTLVKDIKIFADSSIKEHVNGKPIFHICLIKKKKRNTFQPESCFFFSFDSKLNTYSWKIP